MIESLESLRDAGVRRVDLCVIGGGAAGITIARELLGSGLSICLVEAGGLELDENAQELYAGDNVGLPVGLDFGRLRLLGGTTNHWSGRCAPFDPIDFDRRDWVPRSGWPISRADLDPYYLRAQAVCGFESEWPSDAEVLRSLDVSMPPLESPWLRNFIWRYARKDGDSARNWSEAYRTELERAPNLQVLLHANAVAFDSDAAAQEITGLAVRSLGGNSCRIEARSYVLCCGGIENARLLLLGNEHAPEGFGNRHGMVGRNFAQHPRGKSAVLVPAEAMSPLQDMLGLFASPRDRREYALGLALSEQAQRQHGLLNASAVMGYVQDPQSGWAAGKTIVNNLRAGRWGSDIAEQVGRVASDLGSLFSNLQRRVVTGKHAMVPLRSVAIVVDIEQAPDPDSRITLSDERDALGMRRVRMDWRLSDLERHTAERLSSFIAAEFTRLGLGRVRLEDWLGDAIPMGSVGVEETYHHIGSTRMATLPSEGVVDADCLVHGMRNLYVAGSSVFTTGGHTNPTFTIVALALRLADHLKVELQD